MLQVHHLSLETIFHHINESQLITQVLSKGGGGGGEGVQEDDCGEEMESLLHIQFARVILTWIT